MTDQPTDHRGIAAQSKGDAIDIDITEPGAIAQFNRLLAAIPGGHIVNPQPEQETRHKANIPGVHLPHCNQWCLGDAHWLSDEPPRQPLDPEPAEQETRADA